jgi:hypothetical protein
MINPFDDIDFDAVALKQKDVVDILEECDGTQVRDGFLDEDEWLVSFDCEIDMQEALHHIGNLGGDFTAKHVFSEFYDYLIRIEEMVGL